MTLQELAAIAIVVAAAAWLVVRWRHGGVDEEERGGCDHCKVPGNSAGGGSPPPAPIALQRPARPGDLGRSRELKRP